LAWRRRSTNPAGTDVVSCRCNCSNPLGWLHSAKTIFSTASLAATAIPAQMPFAIVA
jgi:hypothetical protein